MSVHLPEQAAWLAERGLYVFPVREKHPITENGFYDAVTGDEAGGLFARYPHATGIGLDCGRSRLLVVDLDGPNGEKAWTRLLLEHGIVETLEVGTARGRHLWLRSRDSRARNSASKLGPHIDTRGAGGYVVAPPSTHPSGGRYRWLNRRPIAPAPGWLLQTLAPPPPPSPVGEPRSLRPGERVTSYGRRALEGLADEVLRSVEGSRNDTFHRAARRAGRLAAAGELDEHLAHDVLLQAASVAGLPQREVELTWRSGFRFGRQYPAARRPR